MVGIPPRLTQATGLDALSHAMEGYTSTAADTATDIINESLMRTIVEWLPKAVENGGDVEARQQMAVCASMAGWMLQYSHNNAGHSIAHILGSHYHIPHGEACAYATPWVLEFNAAAMPDRVMKIGRIPKGQRETSSYTLKRNSADFSLIPIVQCANLPWSG